MNRIKFSCFCVAIMLCASCTVKKADSHKMDVYILMGQSNMAGRGKLASEELAPSEKLLMLTEDLEWVPAKNPLHFDKPKMAGVGPGLSFGELMQKAAHKKVAVSPAICRKRFSLRVLERHCCR